MCRDCEERLGGGFFDEPSSANFMCRDCEERLGGGCFGEPPSAKFMCRDCEDGLGGWLLRQALECQIYVSRLRITPRGMADSASPRVPSLCVAIAKNASG